MNREMTAELFLEIVIKCKEEDLIPEWAALTEVEARAIACTYSFDLPLVKLYGVEIRIVPEEYDGAWFGVRRNSHMTDPALDAEFARLQRESKRLGVDQ